MKFAVGFFAVLASLIGGMLFFQYQTYSTDLELGNGNFYYSQEIEIVYRDNSLDIRHHFKGLPNQRVDLIWPENIHNPDCLISGKNSCNRIDEDLTHMKVGETKTQSVSYVIPIDGGLSQTKLLKNIFATLKNGEVSYSVVHISTDKALSGSWISGLPLVGEQQLSLVNNVMFSGEGPVNQLYWTVNPMAMQKQTARYTIYGNETPTPAFLASIDGVVKEKGHLAIVKDGNFINEETNEFLFLQAYDVDTIENQIIIKQIKQQYNMKKAPAWLQDIIVTINANKTIGSDKAQQVLAQLKEETTDAQYDDFAKHIRDLKGETITLAIMDEQLEAVFGMPTHYFEQNDASEAVFPLLFSDERAVYVNDFEKEDVKVIIKDEHIYYTADTLLTHLGYSAEEGDKGYYVNNEQNAYRFPRLPGFYVHNQTRHDVKSEPIIKVADQYLIEESWLQRIFNIELEKNEGSIRIHSNEGK